MPIEPIGCVTAVLLVFALLRGQEFAICAFVPSMLLGAAAAVNLPAAGSIQPAHMLLATLAVNVARDRKALKRVCISLRCPNPGFWLFCTLVYGVLGAVFIPRIAAAAISVNAIGVGQYGGGFVQVPLGPTTGNITQSIYFAGDAVCFLGISAVAAERRGFPAVVAALLVYCVGDVVMALLDLATYATNTTELLSVIRNANYSIFSDLDEFSTKRIIGSFTEASSFATATLGVFGFTTRLWIGDVRPRLTLTLSMASLALLLFSTATTAYASLPLGLLFLFAGAGRLATKPDDRSNAALFLTFVPLACATGLLAIALHEPTLRALSEFFDTALLNKGESQSGMNRAQFNAEAWQNFLDTGGFGLGIGSVRASNFALAVLANLGTVGAATYASFIASALWPSRSAVDEDEIQQVKAAARVACLCLMVAACVSGALIDLGLPFFVFAGLANARPSRTVDRSPLGAAAAGDLREAGRLHPVGRARSPGSREDTPRSRGSRQRLPSRT